MVQVPAEFKRAVDYAVLDRRSTLRRECTEAVAKHFGLAVPGGAPQTDTTESAA